MTVRTRLPGAHAPQRGHGDHHHHSHTHSHAHGGAHSHARTGTANRRLAAALAVTAAFFFVEAVAGVVSGSLALLSDAGHMLIDVGALALALFAQVLAARERTGQRTFGFRRAEILAALINGSILGVSAIWIIVEAIRRWEHPPAIKGGIMLVVATAGLVANLTSAFILTRGAQQNVNVRAALAHVIADALGSVAAMIAGALVLYLGWRLADQIASIAISLLIIVGSWRLVRASVNVLMEGVPADVDVARVEELIRATPGVASFHDLHIWAVSEGFPIITLHVTLAVGHHGTDVARSVTERLESELGIAHVTVQPESPAAKLVPAAALRRK